VSRHLTSLTEADVAAVRAVVDAAEHADHVRPVDEAVELLLARGLGSGAALWLDEGGFALVRPGEPRELDLVVRPDARRAGLGAALAREVLDDGPWAAWSHGDHPGARALAARLGFRAERSLWVMRLPGDAPLPEAPSEGPTLRAFRPGEDDDELLRVNREAFAHHPEQAGLDPAGLEERMGQPWFDPAGLLVADAGGGHLVGFHWTKVHEASDDAPRHGEVYVIGVDPSAQGGGLGRRLLVAGLAHLRSALGDDAEVVLYVESDNDPAVAMYAKFGFAHAARDTHVQYRRGPVSLGT
jgi:mycothiol synthase